MIGWGRSRNKGNTPTTDTSQIPNRVYRRGDPWEGNGRKRDTGFLYHIYNDNNVKTVNLMNKDVDRESDLSLEVPDIVTRTVSKKNDLNRRI